MSTTTIAPEAATQPTATTRTEGHGERQIEAIREMVDSLLWAGATPSVDRLAEARDELTTRLATHPDDVETLVLFAWVGHLFNAMTAKAGFGPDDDPAVDYANAIAAYDPVLQALDRALALEPENAEAHYCRSAVYGSDVIDMRDGTVKQEPMDLELAVASAEAAVQYDPDNFRYQLALLTFYFMADRFEEAAAVGERIDPDNPYTLWLHNVADPPPVPEGAVFLEEATNHVDWWLMDPALDPRYARSWTEVHMVPTALADLEAFYREAVLGAELYCGDSISQEEGFTTISCNLALAPRGGGGYAPVEDPDAYSLMDDAGTFLLMVVEFRDRPAGVPARFTFFEVAVPTDTPDPFCLVVVQSVAP